MKVIKTKQIKKEPVKSALFTGPVTMQSIIGTELSNDISIKQVNFGRGVRNKFHSHNLEQILIVTEGKGIVATEREEITVGPGDVVFISAREKHWHGATKGSTFSHFYVQSPDSKVKQFEE